MTVWNLDHKHRANGPSIPEQIENGIAFGGLLSCLTFALLMLAVGMGLL